MQNPTKDIKALAAARKAAKEAEAAAVKAAVEAAKTVPQSGAGESPGTSDVGAGGAVAAPRLSAGSAEEQGLKTPDEVERLINHPTLRALKSAYSEALDAAKDSVTAVVEAGENQLPPRTPDNEAAYGPNGEKRIEADAAQKRIWTNFCRAWFGVLAAYQAYQKAAEKAGVSYTPAVQAVLTGMQEATQGFDVWLVNTITDYLCKQESHLKAGQPASIYAVAYHKNTDNRVFADHLHPGLRHVVEYGLSALPIVWMAIKGSPDSSPTLMALNALVAARKYVANKATLQAVTDREAHIRVVLGTPLPGDQEQVDEDDRRAASERRVQGKEPLPGDFALLTSLEALKRARETLQDFPSADEDAQAMYKQADQLVKKYEGDLESRRNEAAEWIKEAIRGDLGKMAKSYSLKQSPVMRQALGYICPSLYSGVIHSDEPAITLWLKIFERSGDATAEGFGATVWTWCYRIRKTWTVKERVEPLTGEEANERRANYLAAMMPRAGEGTKAYVRAQMKLQSVCEEVLSWATAEDLSNDATLPNDAQEDIANAIRNARRAETEWKRTREMRDPFALLLEHNLYNFELTDADHVAIATANSLLEAAKSYTGTLKIYLESSKKLDNAVKTLSDALVENDLDSAVAAKNAERAALMDEAREKRITAERAGAYRNPTSVRDTTNDFVGVCKKLGKDQKPTGETCEIESPNIFGNGALFETHQQMREHFQCMLRGIHSRGLLARNLEIKRRSTAEHPTGLRYVPYNNILGDGYFGFVQRPAGQALPPGSYALNVPGIDPTELSYESQRKLELPNLIYQVLWGILNTFAKYGAGGNPAVTIWGLLEPEPHLLKERETVLLDQMNPHKRSGIITQRGGQDYLRRVEASRAYFARIRHLYACLHELCWVIENPGEGHPLVAIVRTIQGLDPDFCADLEPAVIALQEMQNGSLKIPDWMLTTEQVAEIEAKYPTHESRMEMLRRQIKCDVIGVDVVNAKEKTSNEARDERVATEKAAKIRVRIYQARKALRDRVMEADKCRQLGRRIAAFFELLYETRFGHYVGRSSETILASDGAERLSMRGLDRSREAALINQADQLEHLAKMLSEQIKAFKGGIAGLTAERDAAQADVSEKSGTMMEAANRLQTAHYNFTLRMQTYTSAVQYDKTPDVVCPILAEVGSRLAILAAIRKFNEKTPLSVEEQAKMQTSKDYLDACLKEADAAEATQALGAAMQATDATVSTFAALKPAAKKSAPPPKTSTGAGAGLSDAERASMKAEEVMRRKHMRDSRAAGAYAAPLTGEAAMAAPTGPILLPESHIADYLAQLRKAIEYVESQLNGPLRHTIRDEPMKGLRKRMHQTAQAFTEQPTQENLDVATVAAKDALTTVAAALAEIDAMMADGGKEGKFEPARRVRRAPTAEPVPASGKHHGKPHNKSGKPHGNKPQGKPHGKPTGNGQ